MALANKVIYQNGAIREFAKPEVCEAIKVANANRWTVGLSPIEWDDREARLKKEHEKHANASDKMGMTLKEAMKILNKEIFGIRIKKFDKPLKFEEKLWIRNEKPEVLEALHIVAKNGISVYVPKTALRIRSLIIEKMKAGEGAPAPVSGTPLSAVEGMKLQRKDNKNTDKNPALKESATQFNDALLDEQTKKIEELTIENERLKDQIAVLDACKKHNDKIDRLQIKRIGKEIARLNKIIHKKNLKIDEMRKESSRHLEGKMKMFGENFDLEQELKDKNAVLSDVAEELRLSKIREKNLTEVCQKYMKENEELKKELDEANKHQQQAYRSCADKNKEIRALKLQISALEKRGNGIDWKRNADAIKLYVNRASHERLWSPISQDICNEQELSFIINHGGKRVKYALRFDGTDIVYECSDPDKKPSFFRDDSVGAVTNQKDCSPVKDTHSTEDNPEEIEIEKAVKLVRKAMKEGRTVTIDYKD